MLRFLGSSAETDTTRQNFVSGDTEAKIGRTASYLFKLEKDISNSPTVKKLFTLSRRKLY